MGEEREAAAEFRREGAFEGLAKYRRFGGYGPVYEVLEVRGDRAKVELVESGEVVDVSLAEVLDNPVAT